VKDASAKLRTNLVGRKVHLLTDEEVRDAARKQETPLEPDVIQVLTAELWFPALKEHYKRFGSAVGEIVTVHLADHRLVYTIAFGGELVELHPQLWRLHEDETK
jgi:hypothetical protein